MGKSRKKKHNIALKRFLFAIYKVSFGLFIAKKYRIKVINSELADIDGSFVLLCNHVTNFDGCYLQQYANRAISFIINDKAFRNAVLRRILLYLDMIPKKKFSSDIRTVRNIFEAKKRGDIICIFPEGRRSWDGNTVNIVESTFTLVKSLKLPVIVAKIKGGAISSPRWRNSKNHKGIIELEFSKTLDAGDISKMSLGAITSVLKDALDHNEPAFIKEKGYVYKGKSPASGLERFLFICPNCKKMSTLISDDHYISCSCSYKQKYTNQGLLEGGLFETLPQWNVWQNEYFDKILNDISDDETVFTDSNAELYSAKGYDKFQMIDEGVFSAGKETLFFEGEKFREFLIKDIFGPSIQSNNVFEFNKNDICYRVLLSGKANAYKYQLLVSFCGTDA